MIQRGHLEILRALSRQGTLAEAGHQLSLSQPALTHAIRKLEDRAGAKLWEKVGRGIRLTQAGEHLAATAEQVLGQLEQADAALQAYGEGRRGRLRVGMECYPCYEWLLTVVPDYLAQWQDVDLDVVQRFRFNGLDALAHHRIDMLITSDPVLQPGLAHQPVLDYELRLVLSESHPQAAQQCVSPELLAQQHLIHFPVSRERLDVLTHFLHPKGLEPASQQEVEAPEIMLQLVAAGRGVCTLPDWLAERVRQEYSVCNRRLGEDGVHKTLYLVYRKGEEELQYLDAFLRMGQC